VLCPRPLGRVKDGGEGREEKENSFVAAPSTHSRRCLWSEVEKNAQITN